MLIKGMIRIIEINVKRIVKDSLRLFKSDAVLRKINRCLCLVPLKFHMRECNYIL